MSTKKYSCIFFDLDHTLWDFETNSRQTLEELYAQYDLHKKGVTDFNSFHVRFKEVNSVLWELYDNGKIDSIIIRKERFKQILETFNAYEEKLSQEISHDYLMTCPKKGNLMPGAINVLEYLKDRSYNLSVITNGFEEIQHLKLASGKLESYFDHIITSQKTGHRKPAPEIFKYALQAHNIQHHEAAMIGDNLIADIVGARNAGIDPVYYNPDSIPHNETLHHEISNLEELLQIL
ncbi:MAG TPA: YjjG family noncanonical pyrimidine nucleotidase [Chryseolinea sp.]|nr:YjjG family noncanonical pyrimidine nucleotidase [Chryseolinea sp.]HPM29516.1 YjjG family noncanonical pyrimidine nucleotidase [Chryseolinea sp.]